MSVLQHIKEHAQLGLVDGGFGWQGSIVTPYTVFAAGIPSLRETRPDFISLTTKLDADTGITDTDYSSLLDDDVAGAFITMNPALGGWYAQAVIMPKDIGTITSIVTTIGDAAGASDEFGWAIYDGVTLALLGSGVSTTITGSVVRTAIPGLSIEYTNRNVIIAFMGGDNATGVMQNLEIGIVTLPTPVPGLPAVYTGASEKAIIPWTITGTDYTSPPDPAVLSTAFVDFSGDIGFTALVGT